MFLTSPFNILDITVNKLDSFILKISAWPVIIVTAVLPSPINICVSLAIIVRQDQKDLSHVPEDISPKLKVYFVVPVSSYGL